MRKLKAVMYYLGALCIMFGIMAVVCAGGAEDMEAIKTILKWAAIIAGCSLPFFAVGVTLEAIITRYED